MERAETLEILPGASQRHMLTHDLRDVHPVSDLVNDVVRNQALAHGGPRLCPQGSYRLDSPAGMPWTRLKVDRSP